MKRIAVIGAVLENPKNTQKVFNDIISENSDIVRGRFGIPFHEQDMGIISITVVADMDRINDITGKLGQIPNVSVKTAISKKEVMEVSLP